MFPIVLICDGVNGPANIGSLFRIADAFGVQHIYFANASVDITSARLRKTSRNTYNSVSFTVIENILNLLEELKRERYLFVGLEITASSISLEQFSAPRSQHIALVLGSEQHGISTEVLQRLDIHTHIELFGKNSSINVTHAAAIALHSITSGK